MVLSSENRGSARRHSSTVASSFISHVHHLWDFPKDRGPRLEETPLTIKLSRTERAAAFRVVSTRLNVSSSLTYLVGTEILNKTRQVNSEDALIMVMKATYVEIIRSPRNGGLNMVDDGLCDAWYIYKLPFSRSDDEGIWKGRQYGSGEAYQLDERAPVKTPRIASFQAFSSPLGHFSWPFSSTSGKSPKTQ